VHKAIKIESMKKLSVINTVLLVSILTYLVVGKIDEPKAGNHVYAVTSELYSEFVYQQELSAEYASVKSERDRELSQLKNDLIRLENRILQNVASDEEKQTYEQAVMNYRRSELSINEELLTLGNEYNQKIWDKLNAFTKEFGETNGYEVIFGAGGNGNILHADENKNITTELVAFCNMKYNGK
jgi:Skp family chaperone for outer membrane proteins